MKFLGFLCKYGVLLCYGPNYNQTLHLNLLERSIIIFPCSSNIWSSLSSLLSCKGHLRWALFWSQKKHLYQKFQCVQFSFNLMTGKEVRCSHLMFYFSYNRHVNLDAHDKTALVSLSLTDEPIAVDVVRHSSRDKVGCSLVAPVIICNSAAFSTCRSFRTLLLVMHWVYWPS